MQESNVPATEAGGGLPPPTWDVLWDELQPRPSAVARALAEEFRDFPWGRALKVTSDAHQEGAAGVAAQRRRVDAFADSPSSLCFLVVVDHKVQVLHGWRACRPLNAEGKVYSGLIGDRRVSPSGVELLPRMCRAGETHNEQCQLFAKVAAETMTVAEIQEACEDDPGAALLDGVEGDGEDATAWAVMPAHPKLASLFMHSPTLKEAVKLFAKICQVVPAADRGGLDALAVFIRAGVKKVADKSALELGWKTVNVQETEELEYWHAETCQQWAPKVSEAVPPPSRASSALPADGVMELLATVGAGAHKKEPGKRAYTPSELERLALVCGLSHVDPADLAADHLPPFWRGFEDVRGKLHSARACVEGWFDSDWPADAPRHQRFVSTRLLKDLVALDLDGGDTFCSWSEREGGFSLFSVCPLPDGKDPGARRRRAVAFEDAMDNHRPGERQSMGESSADNLEIPIGRASTWEWMTCVKTAMESVFGEHCEAVSIVQRCVEHLNEGLRFRNFTPNDWRSLFWKLHVALREFFCPTRRMNMVAVQGLKDFLMIARTGMQLNHSDFPAELLGVASPPQGHASRRGTSAQLEGDMNGGGSSEATGLAKRVAKEWERLLARPLKDAKEAITGAGKPWGMKVVFPNGAREALGPFAEQFKPAVSGNTAPCPRLAACGKCATRRCKLSHNMMREPSAGESRACVDWVQRRCTELKNNPGNA